MHLQKPKLKVGKARPKADNQTNTNFKAKGKSSYPNVSSVGLILSAIILNQQSISTEAPTLNTQFLHHVSLLSSRSDSQRKESLAYLTTTIGGEYYNKSLPLPTEALLEKSMPLLLDSSTGVRSQLERMLRVLPPRDIADHITKVLPYVRAAMTHLSQDIRRSALDVLSWLLSSAGNDLVSCPGGWTKTLECCATLLNWRNLSPQDSWNASKTSFRTDSKAIAQAMQVAEQLLSIGLLKGTALGNMNAEEENLPLHHLRHHRIPTKSNAYSYLHLFGMPTDSDSQMLEDPEERLLVFNHRFRPSFMVGIEGAKREGGDLGRIAGQLSKIIDMASVDE